jgi:hypothetical protein
LERKFKLRKKSYIRILKHFMFFGNRKEETWYIAKSISAILTTNFIYACGESVRDKMHSVMRNKNHFLGLGLQYWSMDRRDVLNKFRGLGSIRSRHK